MTFRLETVVPWGRSLSEYAEMFALNERDLQGRILGCGDGPASFNAEATERGYQVVSCDPLYAFSASEIRERVRQTYHSVVAQLESNQADYRWERFRDPVHLGESRLETMERFLEDYPTGLAEGRYVEAALPSLPFANAAFDLALCSHFLFLYSEQHSLAFHVASLRELSRVAREVRVFPLLNLGGTLSAHVEPAIEALSSAGYDCERIKVSYEFQRGGNYMLRIRAESAA